MLKPICRDYRSPAILSFLWHRVLVEGPLWALLGCDVAAQMDLNNQMFCSELSLPESTCSHQQYSYDLCSDTCEVMITSVHGIRRGYEQLGWNLAQISMLQNCTSTLEIACASTLQVVLIQAGSAELQHHNPTTFTQAYLFMLSLISDIYQRKNNTGLP